MEMVDEEYSDTDGSVNLALEDQQHLGYGRRKNPKIGRHQQRDSSANLNSGDIVSRCLDVKDIGIELCHEMQQRVLQTMDSNNNPLLCNKGRAYKEQLDDDIDYGDSNFGLYTKDKKMSPEQSKIHKKIAMEMMMLECDEPDVPMRGDHGVSDITHSRQNPAGTNQTFQSRGGLGTSAMARGFSVSAGKPGVGIFEPESESSCHVANNLIKEKSLLVRLADQINNEQAAQAMGEQSKDLDFSKGGIYQGSNTTGFTNPMGNNRHAFSGVEALHNINGIGSISGNNPSKQVAPSQVAYGVPRLTQPHTDSNKNQTGGSGTNALVEVQNENLDDFEYLAQNTVVQPEPPKGALKMENSFLTLNTLQEGKPGLAKRRQSQLKMAGIKEQNAELGSSRLSAFTNKDRKEYMAPLNDEKSEGPSDQFHKKGTNIS
ncbi:hypothetical protein FGO68_gene16667 [Halteria grandinella]|uniref:Uncharacterized protein n=1 Tax=Halteria grandinella TaxID=5974 RepID=A0A8J8TA82_HALGN|nr:hypothetical protein FGO68_gene16667 [Halteria grandinella]